MSGTFICERMGEWGGDGKEGMVGYGMESGGRSVTRMLHLEERVNE